MAGRVVVLKQGTVLRFAAEPATAGDTFSMPDADPTLVGGRLAFVDRDDPHGNQVAYDLPVQASPLGWSALGSTPGARGYRYRGAGTADDPCIRVLIRKRVIKAVCRGAGVTLANPVSGDLNVALTIGTASDRYCAEFGGAEVRNDAALRRKDAPPPAACACGAVPPTEIRFASRAPSGVCGTLAKPSGDLALDCGVLYFGGGQVATDPFDLTDMEDPTTLAVDCCIGSTLLLGPSPETAVGSKRCSRAGCLFGPPFVIPNATATAQSVCVYPEYVGDGHGTARCDTGEVDLTLPIAGVAFLTGDLMAKRCTGGSSPGLRCGGPNDPMLPDPLCPGGGTCDPDPDLQPCPICNPTTLVCNGGRDNGDPCAPGSDEVSGIGFPTSRDCTVSTQLKVGEIPLPLRLTSGTSTLTATASGTQANVFCGYCRDANETLNFEQVSPGIARPCTSDADCAEPYEACEQRNSGGLAHPATAITEVGIPGGNLGDYALHDATLVSTFCLPPTFAFVIDAPSDLPGPGAISFPGRLQLGSPGGAFTDAISQPAARW
jgi:hypothetical protein